MIDTLDALDFGPLGQNALCLLDLAQPDATARAAELATASHAIVIGIDRAGAMPALDPAPFDALLTTAPAPPGPWVGVPSGRLEQRLAGIGKNVTDAPFAAAITMRVLRIGIAMPFEDALQIESLAYSTLLGGAAFHNWREEHPAPAPPMKQDGDTGSFVDFERTDDAVTLTLARPGSRNGICAGMRDALFEALAAVLDDPSKPTVELRGAGACFSTGGDLAEFGTARDLAAAHAIRTTRSCAALLHRLGRRASVYLHGACVGSGIEIPAAAHHRIGRAGAFFQLPELGMGLMPGAGGTVTLPRAIGRHRTAYMILSGRRIDAPTARAWGLLTALEPA